MDGLSKEIDKNEEKLRSMQIFCENKNIEIRDVHRKIRKVENDKRNKTEEVTKLIKEHDLIKARHDREQKQSITKHQEELGRLKKKWELDRVKHGRLERKLAETNKELISQGKVVTKFKEKIEAARKLENGALLDKGHSAYSLIFSKIGCLLANFYHVSLTLLKPFSRKAPMGLVGKNTAEQLQNTRGAGIK